MIQNLVIGSGGIMILNFIGAIKYLNENNILSNIKKYYGVSAGAILCSMLAIGYTELEIYNFFINFDFKKLIENVDITNIIDNYGLFHGKNMEIVSKYIISFKKGESYSFKQLYNDNNVELNIFAVCVDNAEYIQFNHIKTPNMPIWKAIVASSRIPYLYMPYTIHNKQYIDGAVIDPYPFNYVSKNEINSTIGIMSTVVIDDNIISKLIEIPNIYYFIKVLSISINTNTNLYSQYSHRTINISNQLNVSSINFYLTPNEKKLLIQEGYDNATNQYHMLKINCHDKSTQTNEKLLRSKSI